MPTARSVVAGLAPDVAQLIEQLERHCLAPDGSYLSKSAYSDLQQAREELNKERMKYLEAMAVYSEAMALVEEYQQQSLEKSSIGAREYAKQPPVYKSLDHRIVVAEAAQRLRLPLLSKDGEIKEEEIEKSSTVSRSSLDSTSSSATLYSSFNSAGYTNSFTSGSLNPLSATSPTSSDMAEPGVGGVPNRFLGVTPGFLWQVQEQHPSMAVDMVGYQRCLVRDIEQRLEAKCKELDDIFCMEGIGDSSSITHLCNTSLPERVKLIINEIEREEAVLLDDLCSMDRKFAEHYSVLEQILAVLIKFVKDLKLQHQHEYDDLRKKWLSKRCQTMNAKLRTLDHMLLKDTYSKDSVPALHIIRKYLLEATEEATYAYNRAITRLREYQGVDPHFDTIARQYNEIVKGLESMKWTIQEVEMDIKRFLGQSPST